MKLNEFLKMFSHSRLWLARAKSGDLSLFDIKPEYNESKDFWFVNSCSGENVFEINKEMFSGVHFENSPVPIE